MVLTLVTTALLLAGGGTGIPGGTAASPGTQQLIDQLGSANEQTMRTAVEALVRQGQHVVPALVDALDRRKECQMQFVASGVLRKIEPSNSRIETALATLARGECSGSSARDFVLKQQAAFALSHTVSGLGLLTNMVPDEDVLTRRRVAFAFEDLTEKLSSTAEAFRLPASLEEPTADTLLKLAPFLDDPDEPVRCVTLEAMEQASRSGHGPLAAAGKRMLAGKTVTCGRDHHVR
jgi:hypothetical protein